MIEVLRRAWRLIGPFVWRGLRRWPVLRTALDRRVRSDPELERWTEQVFSELRQAPLVRPSRGIAESLKQRLQQRAGGPSRTPAAPAGRGDK